MLKGHLPSEVSSDDSGLVAARAEDTQWTPTQSHVSVSVLVYEDKFLCFRNLHGKYDHKCVRTCNLCAVIFLARFLQEKTTYSRINQ